MGIDARAVNDSLVPSYDTIWNRITKLAASKYESDWPLTISVRDPRQQPSGYHPTR